VNRRLWIRALLAALLLALLAGAAWWRFGRAIEVPTAPVVEAALPLLVTGPGTVQARVPVTLASRITGTVTSMRADVGDAVPAGTLLVTVDDRDLQARRQIVLAQRETQQRNLEGAEAALARAQAELALARTRARRDAELQARGFLSEAGLDSANTTLQAAQAAEQGAVATVAARRAELGTSAQELRAAQVAESYAQVLAPLDAVVVQRLVEPGATVVPGSPLLRLVAPDSVWIVMRVDEAQLDRVQPGQAAAIRLRSGGTVPGRVVRVARQSDAATREVEVHVAFEQVPVHFVIDAQADVAITTGRQEGLQVPLSALLRDRDGRPGVLRVQDGRTRFVPVRAGAGDAERLLVEGALSAGDRVVAPAAGVREGVRVRPAD
jgi:RND family efflux transporter MFP subunit